MHPSISVYQIGCVLSMSILRASIRTGRFDERKKAANILVSGPNGSANQEDDTCQIVDSADMRAIGSKF